MLLQNLIVSCQKLKKLSTAKGYDMISRVRPAKFLCIQVHFVKSKSFSYFIVTFGALLVTSKFISLYYTTQ